MAGERRLRAAVLVGMSSVPCIICSAKEEYPEHLSIVENCERENLSLYDEARAVARLFEITEKQTDTVARLLSVSGERVEKLCRIATLARGEIEACGKYRENEEVLSALSKIPKNVRLEAVKIFTEKEFSGTALDSFLVYAINSNDRKMLESAAERLSGKRQDKTTVVLRDLSSFYNTLENSCAVLTRAGVENSLSYEEKGEDVVITIKIKRKDM